MKRTEESTFIRFSPDWIDCRTMMPSRAAHAEPRPPKRLVPPMTAAAMAVRLVSVVPELCETEVSWPAMRMPPRAAKVEQSAKTET